MMIFKFFKTAIHLFKANRFKSVKILGYLSLIGFLGQWGWAFDLWSHFRLPYTVLFLMAGLWLLRQKRWNWAAYFIFLLGVNLVTLWPYFFPLQSNNPKITQQIKVVHLNPFDKNLIRTWPIDYLTSTSADIITMNEVYDDYYFRFSHSSLFKLYPYRLKVGELVILSHHKFKVIKSSDNNENPYIYAEFKLRNKFKLLLAHTPAPLYPYLFDEQVFQGNQLTSLIKNEKNPVLVVGDLNTTPWSYPFTKLIKQTGLEDSQRLVGRLQPSWPMFFVIPWLPIDHVLVSKHWQVISRETGPFVGSDHLPVIVKLALKKSE